MPSMQMFLCNDCFESKKEPRFLVILVGRKEGLDAVKDYLAKHKYDGEEIPASDLV